MRYGFIHRCARLLLIIGLGFCLAITQPAWAQLEEQQVKAAILYNFAKFVTWPEDSFAHAEAPLVIAILGDDPLHGKIDRLAGKKIGNRAIAIRHFSRSELKWRKKDCHILYVATSERKQLDAILATVAAAPVLTVSDLADFGRKGGALNFEKRAPHIRFAINLDATGQAGLKVSAKLFPLASTIIKDGLVKSSP